MDARIRRHRVMSRARLVSRRENAREVILNTRRKIPKDQSVQMTNRIKIILALAVGLVGFLVHQLVRFV
jgi:hypothetical protein